MEQHLTVARTARYQLLGTPSATTRHVWVVCHGYGQLAAYFVRHFAFLADADPHTVVVAPEGLSRFYLNGTSGRVGASWMTRDDRQAEINDHVAYLNQLLGQLLAPCPPDVRLTVLGFSQGTATVVRWLAQAPFRPAHLVLWAGTFPPDLARESAERLLRGLPLTVVLGQADQYLSPERMAEQLEYLTALGATPRFLSFAGKHELDRTVLEQLARALPG